MRLGIHTASSGRAVNSVVDLVEQAGAVAAAGLDAIWIPQLLDLDALTVLAVAGHQVGNIELGTAVIPTYPRHPLVLAGQALTTQASSGNRLTLGIGLSHQMVIEGVYGYEFSRPARHMQDYLSVLMPALRGEQVAYEGETLKATPLGPIKVAGGEPPDVLVAALAPVMLRVAGRLADGTATWMVGPKTLGEHIVPSIGAAAAAAGRPAPRVAVGLPVCVTADPDAARTRAARSFAVYGQLPSYRAMLDREGVEGPADVAVVGDEEAVARQLERIADLGATDLMASVFGSSEERRRTMAHLAELAAVARKG
jgi:F420-dependent oxidoreductase-like protein